MRGLRARVRPGRDSAPRWLAWVRRPAGIGPRLALASEPGMERVVRRPCVAACCVRRPRAGVWERREGARSQASVSSPSPPLRYFGSPLPPALLSFPRTFQEISLDGCKREGEGPPVEGLRGLGGAEGAAPCLWVSATLHTWLSPHFSGSGKGRPLLRAADRGAPPLCGVPTGWESYNRPGNCPKSRALHLSLRGTLCTVWETVEL